jgi:hypothetical protein
MLQITQPAMDEFAAGRAGRAAQVTLFDQKNREPAASGIARNTRAIDAPSDHKQIYAIRALGLHGEKGRVPPVGSRSHGK